MPDCPSIKPCARSTGNVRAKFLTRQIVGIACLSACSLIASISLLWACVERGECEHRGPDACKSRIFVTNPEELGADRGIFPGHQLPGFRGNSDFYGLGIRLGIYLQWFASLVANVALDEDLRRTTNIPYMGFQIAVLAALLFLVFESNCTFAAEIFVIFYILLGGIFVVLAPEIVQGFRRVLWHDERKSRYSLFGMFVWIIVGLVTPISAWFWLRLATAHPPTADFYPTPDGTSVFLLAHVRDKGIKTASVFMFMWSVLLGIFAVEKVALAPVYKAMGTEMRFVLFTLIYVLCYAISRSLWLLKAAIEHVIASCRDDPQKSISDGIREALNLGRSFTFGDMIGSAHVKASTKRPETYSRLYPFVIAVISIVLSICAVELTLVWNHVSDVNSIASTGQIIPLFLGVATLVPVMWQFGTSLTQPRKVGDNTHLYDLEACMQYLAEYG